jgi:predicted MFS family arabinose efflux permease
MPQPNSAAAAPNRDLIVLLAVAAGLSVASLYYNNPMLGILAEEFRASPQQIGRLPTWTQLGYAAGILFLTPLGDRIDRRRVILSKMALLALGLLLLGLARTLLQLGAISLLVGVAASLAQDCVPAAAAVASDSQRGKVVGSVMTGLLLGILLSRVVSGAVADQLGWRAVFFLAAAAVMGLFGVAYFRMPRFAPSTNLPYLALLGSLAVLFRKHAGLRRATLGQLLLSSAFSAFWSTLALRLLQPPFEYGSQVAGLFGLAGAAGALAARYAGGIVDRRGSEVVVRAGAVCVLVSFLALALAPDALWVLIAGTLLFDFGIQACVVSHQGIIYALDPSARSRINALFIVGMFAGMAAGSSLGSYAFAVAGWRGVCLYAVAATTLALLVRLFPARRNNVVLESASI